MPSPTSANKSTLLMIISQKSHCIKQSFIQPIVIPTIFLQYQYQVTWSKILHFSTLLPCLSINAELKEKYCYYHVSYYGLKIYDICNIFYTPLYKEVQFNSTTKWPLKYPNIKFLHHRSALLTNVKQMWRNISILPTSLVININNSAIKTNWTGTIC